MGSNLLNFADPDCDRRHVWRGLNQNRWKICVTAASAGDFNSAYSSVDQHCRGRRSVATSALNRDQWNIRVAATVIRDRCTDKDAVEQLSHRPGFVGRADKFLTEQLHIVKPYLTVWGGGFNFNSEGFVEHGSRWRRRI